MSYTRSKCPASRGLPLPPTIYLRSALPDASNRPGEKTWLSAPPITTIRSALEAAKKTYSVGLLAGGDELAVAAELPDAGSDESLVGAIDVPELEKRESRK